MRGKGIIEVTSQEPSWFTQNSEPHRGYHGLCKRRTMNKRIESFDGGQTVTRPTKHIDESKMEGSETSP